DQLRIEQLAVILCRRHVVFRQRVHQRSPCPVRRPHLWRDWENPHPQIRRAYTAMDPAMTNGTDRREIRRRDDFVDHGIVSVRVRPGKPATIVNVSASGALIETTHRLLPGVSVEMHLE